MEVQNKITLEDDFTSELLEIIEHTKDFQRQVQEAKERVDELNKIKATTKIAADNREAIKEISETKKQINEIKKNVAITIAAKDSASKSIRRIKMEAKEAISKPFTAVIKAKDEVSGVIKKITDKVFSLKSVMASLVLAGTGKGLYDWTLGQGVSNEQYLSTLQTTLNSKKKGQDALGWAYKTALDTPFEANQVVEGVSGLAVSQLDYKKFLMPLGNLAAVKNRPLDQAIEFASTLASGDMGEAVERGRDLGISKQMWEKAGMKFDKQGSLTNTPNEALNAVLQIIKNNHWNNLMDNQSKTAGGNISNIKDTIQSMGRGLAGIDQNGATIKGGLFDNFRTQIATIQPMLMKIQSSKAFSQLEKDIGNLATVGGQKFQTFLKSFDNPTKVKQYENTIKTIFGDVKSVGEVGIEYIKGISSVLMPLIKVAAEHPKVFVGLFAGMEVGKGTLSIVSTINNIKKELPSLSNALKSMVKSGGGGLGGVLKLPFTGIKQGLNVIKGLGTSLGNIGKSISKSLVGPLNTVVSVVSKGGRAIATFSINVVSAGAKSIVAGARITASFVGSIIKAGARAVVAGAQISISLVGALLRVAGQAAKTALIITGKLVMSIAQLLRESLVFVASNPILLAISAIVLACAGLYEAWKNDWGGIREKTKTVIDDIKGFWEDLKKFLAHPIKGTINLIQTGTVEGTKKVGKNALGTSYWEGGLTWIDEFGKELIDLPAGSKIYNNRQTMNMLNMNKNMRSQAPNMNFSTGVAKQAEQSAPQAVKWGKDIPTNLAKGIKDNTSIVINATTLMASEIKKLIHFSKPDKGPLADADTYGGDMVKNLGTGIQNNLRYTTVPTTNMTSNTKSIVTGLIQQCPTLGGQVVQEIGAGIQSQENNLTAIVKELTDKVIEAFKTGFGIHSPSRVFYLLSQFIPLGVIKGISSVDIKAFIKKWIGDITGSVGGNVSGWISAALAITGSPMSWLPKLLDICSRESGNPGQLGTGNASLMNSGPGSASGLMQCMPSTFAEFALPGLGDIFNPIANAVAAIRYIKSRYGSPENIYTGPGYKGYATGLKRVPYDNFPALLHEDEEVITGSKARGNKENGAKIIIQKLADKIIVRNDSDIDKIADALYKKLEKAAYNMA